MTFQNTILLQQSPIARQKNYTMKSLRHTAKCIFILFVSLIATPHADAFRSSATATSPIVVPFEPTKERRRRLPKTQTCEVNESTTTNTNSLEKEKTEKRKFKYDLGLGKNQPVNNDNANESSSSSSWLEKRFDPTQFLIEHESVRSYPSPLNSDSEPQSSSSRDEAKDKRRNLPKVQPIRHSEDILHIQDPIRIGNSKGDDDDGDDDYYYFRHPVIAPINNSYVGSIEPAVKFDLNTVWVEMMLHNEHKKIISN